VSHDVLFPRLGQAGTVPPVSNTEKKFRGNRLAAQLPPGFHDTFGDDVERRDATLRTIGGIFHRYGFERLQSPAIEYLDALGKFLPDKDRPNEGVFAWQENEQWLALRYDLTAPLARVAAMHRNTLPTPYRRYAIDPVWRDEKPGPGRFRQFIQCDADTVGSASVAADGEMCILAMDILESLGVAPGSYTLRLNNRKILDGILQAAGLGPADSADGRYGIVLRAIDKLDRLGLAAVQELLGAGRRDASGDFTKGAGLGPGQIDLITHLLELGSSPADHLFAELRHLIGDTDEGSAGLYALEQLMEFLVASHASASSCTPDMTIVRGLGYYTGFIVEAELTSDGPRLGSVVGGGRYDGLVRRFTGHDVPATGISVGIERLLLGLAALQIPSEGPSGPVLVTVMDRNRLPEYQHLVTLLRSSGIRAELYLGNARNFGKQLKYADQRNCPVAVIQGEDERLRNVLLLKDLHLGRKIAQSATKEAWKARDWQVEIAAADLVAEVGKILARYPHSFPSS